MKTQNTPPSDLAVGLTHKTNNYGKIEILEYKNYNHIKVRFIATSYTRITNGGKIRAGVLKDLYHPNVCGVGFAGDGEYSKTKNNDAYCRWNSMLLRCYSSDAESENPTYAECTVCEEWHNFQNFAKWYYNNHPKDGERYQLDKDLTIIGNKIYSPLTCMFVSQSVNLFTVSRDNDRGSYMIGVSFDLERGKFKAQCNNPFTAKNEYIGRFPSEIEAHMAWRKRKSQHAYKLAIKQSNPKVRDALLRYKLAIDSNSIHMYQL